MKAYELLKINSVSMQMMSSCDIRRDDYIFIPLFEDYVGMRRSGEKYTYIITVLSERYGISDSSVKRIIRRFSREVKV